MILTIAEILNEIIFEYALKYFDKSPKNFSISVAGIILITYDSCYPL